jgi:hypothetical protein
MRRPTDDDQVEGLGDHLRCVCHLEKLDVKMLGQAACDRQCHLLGVAEQ